MPLRAQLKMPGATEWNWINRHKHQATWSYGQQRSDWGFTEAPTQHKLMGEMGYRYLFGPGPLRLVPGAGITFNYLSTEVNLDHTNDTALTSPISRRLSEYQLGAKLSAGFEFTWYTHLHWHLSSGIHYALNFYRPIDTKTGIASPSDTSLGHPSDIMVQLSARSDKQDQSIYTLGNVQLETSFYRRYAKFSMAYSIRCMLSGSSIANTNLDLKKANGQVSSKQLKWKMPVWHFGVSLLL